MVLASNLIGLTSNIEIGMFPWDHAGGNLFVKSTKKIPILTSIENK